MHIRSLFFSLSSLTLPLAAQTEVVSNGTFTGTLLPWTLGGGYSVNPQLDTTYATNGMTVSDSFGCGPGGQVTPAPYPANTLEQTISVVGPLTYELRADLSSSRAAATGSNADAGTVWVEVNGVEVARVAFGTIAATETKRAQLCARFTPGITGPVTLRFSFARNFTTNSGTPRCNLDNVSVLLVSGPTFCIQGNRKIATSNPFVVLGAPSALYAAFLAGGKLPAGVSLPSISGLFWLDPLSTVQILSGSLDVNGKSSVPVPIPNDAALTTVPLYYQAVTVNGAAIDLSYHFGTVFTK